MKYISKLLFLAGLAVAFVACNKVADLPHYGKGGSVTLSSSTATVAALPADSTKDVLTLSWTSPGYATDTSNYKYTIEIDSANKNFSKPASKVVVGSRSATFTAKELNTILLDRGYAFNVPVDMDVRVISSYANNNERLISNTLRIKMTPYKIPPKVALPTTNKLFIVGDATQGGWNNPVPTPSQEFARLDETTFAGIFNLVGGKEFLILPSNGDWSKKYALTDNSVSGISAGGNFGYHVDGQAAPDPFTQNFKSPATSGLYRIELDFQLGKFTITPYTSTLPTNLFIVGDATAGGWNNPVPVPSQQLTRVNSSVWTITMPMIGGKQYLLLPSNGDWSHKYAVASNSVTGLSAGGDFGYDFADNFPGPSASGTYTLTVNFAQRGTAANAAGKFTVQ
jgi:hypothetical protein